MIFNWVSEAAVPVDIKFSKAAKASTTAAPVPAPSKYTILVFALAIVTVAPEPCLIISDWDPDVAFSMNITRLTVSGPIVTVQVLSKVPVYLRYMDRTGSDVPSLTVEA